MIEMEVESILNLDVLQMRNDKIAQFNKKGIYTIEDLVNFLPRKYYDFTEPEYIMYLENDIPVCTIGTIQNINLTDKVLQFDIMDDKGWHLYVCFFHMDYMAKQFEIGDRVLVCGVVKQGRFKTMFNPTVFTRDIAENMKIHPVYSNIKGMSSEFLEGKIKMALQLISKEDFIEPELQKKYGLISNYQALKSLHYPETMDDVKQAKKRLLFNDLFLFNYHMKEFESKCSKETNVKIEKLDITRKIIASLPYPLTEGDGVNTKGQKDVLNDLTLKMMNGERIQSIVQGEVGTGKTIVALLLSSLICENGYQCAFLAPTGLLAQQHYSELKERLEPFGFHIAFLSSDLKKSEQNKVLKELKNGDIDVIIGTHALCSDNVQFKNLGLSIIDEEQRFGVEQREKLDHGSNHVIRFSATPIPRSLAMATSGSLVSIETLNVMPSGREKIETHVVLPSKKNEVYFKILEELDKGHQAYIVCMLKDENEKMSDLVDIHEEYNSAKAYFGRHGYEIGMIYGSTKKTDLERNEQVLADFRAKKIQILIASTIIETGISVPDASIMLINNCERLGCSVVHQLRGRLARCSGLKGYCYLMTDNVDKLKFFETMTNGFEVAEMDLKMRGSGSFLGTEQSGENKYLMLILGNKKLNDYIKKDVDAIFADENRRKKYHDLIEIQEV